MKYLPFLSAIVLFATSLSAQSSNKSSEFVLNGKIIGEMSGYLHLKYISASGTYIQDSCVLKNNSFQFKGRIIEPMHASLEYKHGDEPNATEIFLEPDTMKVIFEKNNFKHGKITGSKTQDEYSLLMRQRDTLSAKWKPTLDELKNARLTHNSAKENRIYNKEIPIYRFEDDSLYYQFIKQHRDSYASAFLLFHQNQVLPLDSLKMFYEMFSPKIQQSYWGKRINDFITKAERIAIGKQALDFTQTDMYGKPVSLKDFKGKIVLLEFWASWCGPCREEGSYLKQIFNKYKDKNFTIVGISMDRAEDKDAWIEAIKQDGYTWTQLSDLRGNDNEVAQLYNVLLIPDNFLIDSNGIIIARGLRGEELEKKLKEVIR